MRIAHIYFDSLTLMVGLFVSMMVIMWSMRIMTYMGIFIVACDSEDFEHSSEKVGTILCGKSLFAREVLVAILFY
jgi:hypothetical protein